tara:strand:- start:18857 stop:19054 length:198 start_codon:yes stop_codon:yes gene_type:complete
MRVTHLNKGPSGMASMTACGRNILRTPVSTNWDEFKVEPAALRCVKCVNSKQFDLNTRIDARKSA